jgi:hypothetical protein
MECIERGEICKHNFKCKVCKLEDCKNILKMIEEEEKMYHDKQEQKFVKQMQKQYPSCTINGKLCTILEVLDLENGKVRCSYMINKRCTLK